MLKNSPPAQRALMLLDHDPQEFWHALEFYLRFADPSDVATGLRGSVPSLNAENRSQLALFIGGPQAGSQLPESSSHALNSEIERVCRQPGFKASVEAFLKANPRAVAQLSSRLLQDLLEVAEDPHAGAGPERRDGHSAFVFGENDHPGSGMKRRIRFDIPSWALPLGAFFVGSIITALVISSLFGRNRPASQPVVAPVYFATAAPVGAARPVIVPNGYGAPPQTMTQQMSVTPPPAIGQPLNNIVGSGAPNFDRQSNRSSGALRRGVPPQGAGKTAAMRNASPGSRTASGAPAAPNDSKATPAATETPLTVEPENQTFVAVPQPSPAPVSSLSPSELMLAIPTPESVKSPAASASPAPTPTPRGRKRIRLGYRCAKCP